MFYLRIHFIYGYMASVGGGGEKEGNVSFNVALTGRDVAVPTSWVNWAGRYYVRIQVPAQTQSGFLNAH